MKTKMSPLLLHCSSQLFTSYHYRYQIKPVPWFQHFLLNITPWYPRMQTVANHAPLDRNHHCHCQSDFCSSLYRRLAVDSFSISVTQQPYVFLSIQSVTSPWPLKLYREDIAQLNQLYRQLSTRGRNSTPLGWILLSNTDTSLRIRWKLHPVKFFSHSTTANSERYAMKEGEVMIEKAPSFGLSVFR